VTGARVVDGGNRSALSRSWNSQLVTVDEMGEAMVHRLSSDEGRVSPFVS